MNINISEKLKTLRINNGFSAIDVLNKLKKYKLNYSIQSIYKWEAGGAIPNIYTIYAFADIYNCSVSYLTDDKPLHPHEVTLNEARALRYYRENILFKDIADLTLKLITKYNQ